ncbi:6-bladed beta-propeller [candidate division KSB1 bacterium]|nr:6-bladed beta-propeller [candidate division KSB1 bacterium]
MHDIFRKSVRSAIIVGGLILFICLTCTKKDKITEVFQFEKEIQLETNDNCLIGNPGKLKLIGDQFYLLDSQAKALLIFSKNGKFNKKLAATGQGPGEYQAITDFAVTDSGVVFILDMRSKKIIKFDIDFDYLDSYDLTQTDAIHSYCNIIPHENRLYLLQESVFNEADQVVHVYDVTLKKFVNNIGMVHTKELPHKEFRIRITGGSMLILGDYLFFNHATYYAIQKYTQTGFYVGTFESKNKNFHPYPTHLDPNISPWQLIRKEKYTPFVGMYTLDGDLIMAAIELPHKDGYSYDIYNIDGELVHKELTLKNRIKYCEGKLAYLIEFDENSQSMNLENPRIIVYRVNI